MVKDEEWKMRGRREAVVSARGGEGRGGGLVAGEEGPARAASILPAEGGIAHRGRQRRAGSDSLGSVLRYSGRARRAEGKGE